MGGSKLKIAIVTSRLIGQDAVSNFTMASAEALKQLGEVAIYAFAYERPRLDGVDVHFMGGANAHTLGTNLKALLGSAGLARELALNDILIIVNPDVGSLPACRLAKKYNPRLKVVWTFHGLTPVGFVSGARDRLLMRVRRWATIRSMRRTGAIQVFSRQIRGEVCEWGIDPGRITVMTMGVDVGRMGTGDGRKVRERYGIGDSFLLLYVGRLMNFKHVDELVRATAKVDSARLMVVGGGPERERLEGLARELGVDGRVAFAGRVPDEELPDYYAACDAWATASRHEGFCVPVIEAMAAGRPAVVPDVTAMPETAGEAGLVYPGGSVEGLAERIRELMSDRQLYDGLAGRAAARAAQFGMPRAMESYTSFIREIYRSGP